MTSKQAGKPEDSANAELVQSLSSVINESALHDWFERSAKLMAGDYLSARGWNATIEASSVSVGFRSSWGAYVLRAFDLQRLSGGREVSVKVLFTTVQDAVRHESYKGDGWSKRVSESKSFADFRAKVPARKKSSGGEQKTADSIIAKALEQLAELDDPFIRNIELAEALVKGVRSLVNSAKSPNHPANRAA